MTLEARQQALIDDLNLIPDLHERLAALGSKASPYKLADEDKADTLLVPGCASRVWLDGEVRDGLLRLRFDADSPMVHSLIAVLCQLYDGGPPSEVVQMEPRVWKECGFERMLSPTRLNGLAAVRQRIRELASLGSLP
jgi:cysteine desulfuration protein SufE